MHAGVAAGRMGPTVEGGLVAYARRSTGLLWAVYWPTLWTIFTHKRLSTLYAP